MMPELPEVETVKETLKTLILDKTIKAVSVGWPKMVKHPDDAEQFKQMLEGQTFKSIERRGKFLIFGLDDFSLVSHLRMEGRYGLFDSLEEPALHTHVRFTFEDGTELRYADVRKFGTMHLFPAGEESGQRPLSLLGPEPLEESFTAEELGSRLVRTTRAVKSALLDQSVVAGLGNIYVDEALFKAQIHPEKPACDLGVEEIAALFHAIRLTLNEAVAAGGSSIKTYVNGQGEMGMFQQSLDVYGRKGQPCHTCGDTIIRTVVGGRGTHTCPSCQSI